MGNTGRVRTRRARWTVVLAVAVVLAAVAGIGVWLVLGTSDDGVSDDGEGLAIVTVRVNSGQLLVFDLDGEEIDTFDTGFQRVDDVSVRGRYAIAHNGSKIRQAATIVDLVASKAVWSKAVWKGDLPDGHQLAWLPGSSAPVAVSQGTDKPVGGVLVIDATAGKEHQLTIPGFTELSVVASPDGRWIAASQANDGDPAVSTVDLDGRSDELREARFDAITDDRLATSDLAGAVTLRDRDGAARGSVPRGGVGEPGFRMEVVAVTGPDSVVGIEAADGITIIWESSIGGEKPSELAQIDTDEEQTSGVIVQPDIGRLVVPSGGGESTVLDLAGKILSVVPGTPVTQRSANVDRNRLRCFLTADSDTIRLVDLDDGSVLAASPTTSPTANGQYLPASTDGCTRADGRTVLTRSGAHELPDPASGPGTAGSTSAARTHHAASRSASSLVRSCSSHGGISHDREPSAKNRSP